MKSQFLTIVTILLCLSLRAQVFDLYEQRTTQKTLIKDGGIVDINGSIIVSIKKDNIGLRVREQGWAPVDVRSEDLKKLSDLLKDQQRIMELLTKEVSKPDFASLEELRVYMLPYYGLMAEDPELLAKYEAYFKEYEALPAAEQARYSADTYIFSKFMNEAAELSANINQALGDSNLRFSLAGFIRSPLKGRRPVKLSDDFDEFQSQYYVVPQWEFSLSEEDKKELKQIASFADNIKKLKETSETKLDNLLSQSFQSKDCLKDLEKLLQIINDQAEVIFPQTAQRIKEQLMQPYIEASQLVLKYIKGEQVSPEITNVDLLVGFNDDLISTSQRIDSLIKHMDKGLATIFMEIPTQPTLNELKRSYETCKDRLKADRKKIQDILNYVTNFINDAKHTVEATRQISEQVKRLGFNSLPTEATIDLGDTGYRENGDQVIIRAIVWREIGGREVPVTLDERKFTITQIGLYSVVKPVLILANPWEGKNTKVNIKSDFQFAPSYSMLFKFGCRKSHFINNFLSPGIGFNFSATDFNTDGTPEFGAGLELSLVRDYLATGVGYNFGVDEPYYYFGFRLPFGTVPLPLFNSAP